LNNYWKVMVGLWPETLSYTDKNGNPCNLSWYKLKGGWKRNSGFRFTNGKLLWDGSRPEWA